MRLALLCDFLVPYFEEILVSMSLYAPSEGATDGGDTFLLQSVVTLLVRCEAFPLTTDDAALLLWLGAVEDLSLLLSCETTVLDDSALDDDESTLFDPTSPLGCWFCLSVLEATEEADFPLGDLCDM
mmetsp:Transcript_3594/g.13743  ORF Transcript_3594/g.13743 Transcript_3594/m.13743 type:complete len:127 (+) Transcript_3594:408-788(+)